MMDMACFLVKLNVQGKKKRFPEEVIFNGGEKR